MVDLHLVDLHLDLHLLDLHLLDLHLLDLHLPDPEVTHVPIVKGGIMFLHAGSYIQNYADLMQHHASRRSTTSGLQLFRVRSSS
jgi:hypothetical protein